MNQKEIPNYYSVIPATVRYCKNLSAQEKLLYSEITALTNYKGYCWATNNYFANLYGLSKKTISRQISNPAEHGFIHVEMIYFENSNQIKERQIYLIESNINKIKKNADTPMDKNMDTPMDKNAEDNNTRYNTTSVISNPILSDRFNILSDQLPKNVTIKKEKTDRTGYDTIPNQPVNISGQKNKEDSQDAPFATQSNKHSRKPSSTKYNYTEVEEQVKQNISYDFLLMDNPTAKGLIDEIVLVIVSTITTEFQDGYISMRDERVPAEMVKSIFLKLSYDDIQLFLNSYAKQTEPITKVFPYIRNSLYQNKCGISHHYANKVAVDFPAYSGK